MTHNSDAAGLPLPQGSGGPAGPHAFHMSSFPCQQCGLCCQHVDLAEQTRFLDRGDGVCGHYDALRKACSIYDDRPDICRVDLQYTLHYAQRHTWKEFVELNLQVCAVLQAQHDAAADAVAAPGNPPS